MTVVPFRSNVEQVERLMSALTAGDDATVLRLVDPAVELVPLTVAAGLVPDAYHGLDGIRAYLGDADAADVERGFVATRVRDPLSSAHGLQPRGQGVSPSGHRQAVRGGNRHRDS